jgi:hypothetical protein
VIQDLKKATKEELLEEARARAIPGRAEMDKDELAEALKQSYKDHPPPPPPEPRIG